MSLENAQVRDYLLLLLLTGLRRTEAIRLRWSNIDFEEQTLTIPAEVSKNHREHRLPLSDFLLSMLENRRSQSGKTDWAFPREYADELMAYPYDAIRVVADRAVYSPRPTAHILLRGSPGGDWPPPDPQTG
jgi:integrase